MRTIWSLLISIGAIFICACLYPFRNLKIDRPTPESLKKPNALLVHGWIHNETAWGLYRHYLKKAGFGTINVIAYRSITQDIPQNSLILKERIDLIKKETGQDIDILIGHSQGGLESLEYALEYAPKDRITTIITLGSPLHGTKMARKHSYSPSVRQMRIGSPYLKSLHERLSKASHLRILSLAGTADLVTIPYTSALLPEYPFATNVEIENQGHISFLFSKRSLNEIVAFLQREGLISKEHS